MVNDLPDPNSREGQELARMLTPNETVLAVGHYKLHVLGSSNDLHHYLIATNLRVIIIKPTQAKMLGLVPRQVVSSFYPYRDISSVDMYEVGFSKYVANIGHVRLNIRGSEAYQINRGIISQRPKEENSDPWLPNIAQFGKNDEYRQAFRRVVDVINQQIVLAHSPTPPSPAPQPAAPSIPEQIQQLLVLRDAGGITPQEFEAKKAELLSRM
jgi:hypothetical protein